MSLGECHSDSTLALDRNVQQSLQRENAASVSQDIGAQKQLLKETGLEKEENNASSYISDSHARCQGSDEKGSPLGQENEQDRDDPFEVNWDGDHDPRNPRNMSKARKWVIVLVVSMSSLCV